MYLQRGIRLPLIRRQLPADHTPLRPGQHVAPDLLHLGIIRHLLGVRQLDGYHWYLALRHVPPALHSDTTALSRAWPALFRQTLESLRGRHEQQREAVGGCDKQLRGEMKSGRSGARLVGQKTVAHLLRPPKTTLMTSDSFHCHFSGRRNPLAFQYRNPLADYKLIYTLLYNEHKVQCTIYRKTLSVRRRRFL